MKIVKLSGLFFSEILPVEEEAETPRCGGAVHGPDKTGTNKMIISLSEKEAQEARNASINKDLAVILWVS